MARTPTGRPVIIVQGENRIEYASTCAVPIVHRAGEAATETDATAHWWKNTGNQTVVLLSADLFPVKASEEHINVSAAAAPDPMARPTPRSRHFFFIGPIKETVP